MERDKYLTEAMGHEYIGFDEAHKAIIIRKKGEALNTYLSPWQWFGLVWEWMSKQASWEEFCYSNYADSDCDYIKTNFTIGQLKAYAQTIICIVNPARYADAVYEFLRNRNEQTVRTPKKTCI